MSVKLSTVNALFKSQTYDMTSNQKSRNKATMVFIYWQEREKINATDPQLVIQPTTVTKTEHRDS